MNTGFKKELTFQKKLLITFLFLTIYKIGTFIAVPGIDNSILKSMLGSTDLGTLSSMMSGGGMLNFSIFALGVIPYITASIIIQLLSFNMVPYLMELKKQGEIGKKETKKITIILAVILSIFQATSITFGFSALYEGFIVNDAWYNYALIILILTLGSCLLIYFAEKIDKVGIGNGMSILIFGSILMSLPSAAISYYSLNLDGAGDMLFIEIIKTVLLLLVIFALIFFVTFVHLSERQIPIKNIIQKNTRNLQGVTGNEKNFLPLKVLGVGVIPVIFAAAVIMIPSTLSQLSPTSSWAKFVTEYLTMNSLTGGFLYCIIIIFFTYFYTFLQFNPDDIAKNLQKGQSFIPGIKPGEDTAQYLNDVLFALATIAGIILMSISIIPLLFSAILSLPMTIQIGGISLLIIVNVTLEAHKNYKISKQKEEKQLQGFIKKK